MKKNYLIIAGLFALIIVSCGGGGSSGGGVEDMTVFRVTTTDASNVTTVKYEKSVFSEVDTLAYPFAEAPGGTYTLETITRSDEEDLNSPTPYGSNYYSSNGDEVENVVISSEYTNITDVTSDEPATVVVGQTYTATLIEEVYSLAPATEGQHLCTRTITSTLEPAGIEEVTVHAGTYSAMKILTTTTVDESDDDVVITSTGSFWYDENKDIVKSDLSYTSSLEGTGTVHIVYELFSRSDASSSLLVAGSFQSPNLSSGTSMRYFLRGFVAASKSLSLQ